MATIEQLQNEIIDLKDVIRRHRHDGVESEKLCLEGITAPGFRPLVTCQIYVDTVAGKVYISTGTATSTDWRLLN